MTDEKIREIEETISAKGTMPDREYYSTLGYYAEELLAEVKRLREEQGTIIRE